VIGVPASPPVANVGQFGFSELQDDVANRFHADYPSKP
jgi:hypothetical protein